MSRKRMLAIVWPANPLAEPDMLPEEADPEAHRVITESTGAVYWDSAKNANELRGPLNGYIYIRGAIRYRCRVAHVIHRETLLQMKDEQRYVPEFRYQCLFGQFRDGREHEPSRTWIKILGVEELRNPIEIQDVARWNGQPLRAVRGDVVYIEDPLPQE